MNTHLPAPFVPEDEDAPFYDIAPRSRVTVGEIEYIYEQRVGAGYKLARADDVRLCGIFTRSHMHRLIQAEEVRIEEGYFTALKAEFRLRAGPKTFSSLTEEQVEKVLFIRAGRGADRGDDRDGSGAAPRIAARTVT